MSENNEEVTLLLQIESLIGPWEGNILRRYCHLSNASALLWDYFKQINWVGFYLVEEGKDQLILGPFQGKVACTDIQFSRGVCGKAARSAQSQLVEDVHLFPGHIACDVASRSELVVPILDARGDVVALIDVDSPLVGRFTKSDQTLLEQVSSLLAKMLWT